MVSPVGRHPHPQHKRQRWQRQETSCLGSRETRVGREENVSTEPWCWSPPWLSRGEQGLSRHHAGLQVHKNLCPRRLGDLIHRRVGYSKPRAQLERQRRETAFP